MRKSEKVPGIAKDYRKRPSIVIFGSHSAKETGAAAKVAGLRTILIAEKGRETLYAEDNRWLYDEVIILDSFKGLIDEGVQDHLIEQNGIFIPNRSFSSYIDLEDIENNFYVPMFGSRMMLRTEERSCARGQYYLLEKAGIKIPKKFETPEQIDRLAIVKVQQAGNNKERGYFLASSAEDYETQAEEYVKAKVINEEGLGKARIEEYVLGSRFNADFHAHALTDIFGSFGFVGFSDRRQVNLQGFLNLPAKDQLKINIPVKNEEIGHYGVTMRESKQPVAYEAAKKFLAVCAEEYPPGLIGMFGLQGAIAYSQEEKNKLEYYIFDVSPRVPGDPAIGPTSPEMRILSLKYGRKIEDPLDLTMMEIDRAFQEGRLAEVVT